MALSRYKELIDMALPVLKTTIKHMYFAPDGVTMASGDFVSIT